MTQDLFNDENTSNWSLNCIKCENNYDSYENKADNIPPAFENTSDIILNSVLNLDGKSVHAYLTTTEICWLISVGRKQAKEKRTVKYKISLCNTITAQYEQTKGKDGEDTHIPTTKFVLHFAKQVKNKWKAHSLSFSAEDISVCESWVEGIKNIIKDFDRPTSLLVFINPVGGKKLAQKIYSEKAAPYFKIANVNVTAITTERVNHARDYIQNEDLTNYDGVVSVGGDGLCSEIVNGMLEYTHEKHQVKKNNKDKPMNLGIIPAGSTDTVAYCTSGTNDGVTAALNIILGRHLALDICSVWEDGILLKYSMSLMGYGYFGDLIKESESLQWLGPKRYDIAGFKRFMINKSYEGEVRFIKADENDKLSGNVQCRSECKHCSTFKDEKDNGGQDKEVWQSVKGRYISIIGANLTCRCARSSTGISPLAHNGDGYIDLILVRKTTRAKYLHHLLKVSDANFDQFNFDFIEVHRVKEFTFSPTPQVDFNNGIVMDSMKNLNGGTSEQSFNTQHSVTSDTSVWNVDGELVETPQLHIKVHRQLISLYATGVVEE